MPAKEAQLAKSGPGKADVSVAAREELRPSGTSRGCSSCPGCVRQFWASLLWPRASSPMARDTELTLLGGQHHPTCTSALHRQSIPRATKITRDHRSYAWCETRSPGRKGLPQTAGTLAVPSTPLARACTPQYPRVAWVQRTALWLREGMSYPRCGDTRLWGPDPHRSLWVKGTGGRGGRTGGWGMGPGCPGPGMSSLVLFSNPYTGTGRWPHMGGSITTCWELSISG